MDELSRRIDDLLALSPYSACPGVRRRVLLDVLKSELDYVCQRSPALRNYYLHWPVHFSSAQSIADLPYLPVRALKAQPPLSLVDQFEIKRTLTSSSTTGQTPSRIVLDSPTARRMTKGAMIIAQDFIGPARRPYLVVDVASSIGGGPNLGARGAAIQGLQPFASQMMYCLNIAKDGDPALDIDKLVQFAETHRGCPVLVYGFTYILWKYLVKPLRAEKICLGMANVHVMHSGGWKLLQQEAVDKKTFNEGLACSFGCSSERIIDFYGMVENVGIIYPDCSEGNKHVPSFGEVIVRDPLTLEPVRPGEQGILQVCSALPTSFPGHLLLTEDFAELVTYDGCACGRRGTSFRFKGRVPKAEVRGCGNIERNRQRSI